MLTTRLAVALSFALQLPVLLGQAPLVESIGPGCGGVGGAPTGTVAPNLTVGRPFQFQLRNMTANSAGLMLTSWNGNSWGSTPIPLPLAGAGMPGCTLYTRPESVYPFMTGQGSVDLNFTVPNVPGLAGANVYAQAFFQQPGLNPLGAGNSEGMHMVVGGQGQWAASVSQWGITWTFDRQYPVGQFCNGDWWVVGPVNVVDISPHTASVSGRTINGSMVNPAPTGRHGYDSTLYGQYSYGDWSYFPALNVALGVSSSSPLVLQPSSSLISVISQMTPDPGGHMSQLSTAAVMTVLGAVPPPGSFRPPYTGNDKTVRFQESQLQWGALAMLDTLPNTPQPSTIEPLFERVWLDHCPDWMSRFMHPVLNMKDYGRDFTADTGSAALLVNMNFTQAQKRKLVIGLTQLGIDNWANVLGGATWPGLGGQGSGRKFPILFAGQMLNDAAMRNVGTSHRSYYNGPTNNASIFSEDCQTFYVQETSPGVFNWGNGGYNATHVGMPEWGNNHTTMIYRDNSSWSFDPYRVCCTANAFPGFVLAVRVMGLRSAWNHPALFDYMDRYMQQQHSNNYMNSWISWQGDVWYAYRSQF